MPENSALPSVRTLSNELKISALTVKKAYDRLESDGFVVTVHGKGTYVASTNQEMVLESRKKDVENDLFTVVSKAKNIGMTDEEILEILNIILEEL